MWFLNILLPLLSLLSFVYSVPTVILPATSTDMNDTSFAPTNQNGFSAGPPAYRCETSNASPLSGDTLLVTTFLRGRNPDKCQQTNGGGSQCKKLQTFGSTSVGICASHGEWLQCSRVADVVRNLVILCQRFIGGKWRAGGYIIVEHPTKAVSHKIIVYNIKEN